MQFCASREFINTFMDIGLIFAKPFEIYAIIGVLAAIFYFAKFSIQWERVKNMYEGKLGQKIIIYFVCAVCVAGISLAASYEKLTLFGFFSNVNFSYLLFNWFILLIIPAICGAYSGIKRDKYLSEEEKNKDRDEINR